jgi:hypothetical protein
MCSKVRVFNNKDRFSHTLSREGLQCNPYATMPYDIEGTYSAVCNDISYYPKRLHSFHQFYSFLQLEQRHLSSYQLKEPEQRQELGMGQVQELGMGQVQELGMGQVQELGMGQVQELGMGQVQELGMGQV